MMTKERLLQRMILEEFEGEYYEVSDALSNGVKNVEREVHLNFQMTGDKEYTFKPLFQSYLKVLGYETNFERVSEIIYLTIYVY